MQGRKLISYLPTYIVTESLSFRSALEESNAEPVPHILKGFFVKMSVEF
jgi:hypothetical protein